MTLGKREKIMIGVLVGLVYMLIFFNFVLLPSVSEIKETNSSLKTMQEQKKKLDQDYKNIERTKFNLKTMKSESQKLDSYIMPNSSTIDALEYMDRMVLVGGTLKGVKISAPVQSANASGVNYYETDIDFNTDISQQKLHDLISYIEQGSQKASIKKMNITGENKGSKYNVNMTIALYSIDKGNADKFEEYRRHKISEYNGISGVFFDTSASNVSAGVTPSSGVSASTDSASGGGQPDIFIKQESFLAAGPNLRMYARQNATNSINIKTDKERNVDINVEGTGYSVATTDDDGANVSFTGTLPDGDLNISVLCDLVKITENQNIKLNVRIINKTTKRVNVLLKDDLGRVTLLDRDNKSIVGNSYKEKVIIS